MNELEWNERFNIGVEVIDKAHKRLFSIVRKLVDLNEEEEKRRWACEEGIKYFKSYTVRHFAEEEEYMKSINYKGYAIHKKLHDEMRDMTIPALERELVEREYSEDAVQHFLGICLGWLTGHIMIEDHAITGRVSHKWVYNPREQVVSALRKALEQAMWEVFKVKGSIVSEHYSGSEFGKGIYYRMVYRSKKGEKVQVMMVLEESQVLRIVGELLGIQLNKVVKMVNDATRQVLQYFMQNIGTHFNFLKAYELEKDNILTADQFRQEFSFGYPQYSMLYDTGMGYFAFCIKKG